MVKLKKNAPVSSFSPTKELLDKDFIGRVIVECLNNNDPEGVIEAIRTYLEVLNKSKSSERANLSRSTLYHSLKSKNPTLKTLAKLMHASAAAIRR
jgi:DNA-binding phage protein